MADYPLDDKGTTYRGLILQKYPDLNIDFMHHAGNSSGVVDGSAAIMLAVTVLCQGAWVEAARACRCNGQHGRLADLDAECPVPAARKVLAKAGLALEDIDLFEINEALAVVAEKFIRDLALDRDKVNVNGGSIALGHPIGATGSILIGTILDELERRDLRRGLVTMCAAGGMAPAIIIERVSARRSKFGANARRTGQPTLARLSSSGEFKYAPDMVSTQHRWSCTLRTPATFSAPTMAACRERSSVITPLRWTMPSRTITPRPNGHQSLFVSASTMRLRM